MISRLGSRRIFHNPSSRLSFFAARSGPGDLRFPRIHFFQICGWHRSFFSLELHASRIRGAQNHHLSLDDG